MVDKILSDEYPYQDTVSVSTWVLIKQLQTWYLNVTLEGENISGKLKGMGGFSGKETIRTLHLLMEVSTTVRIFCCSF
jgi:hypothetical protein